MSNQPKPLPVELLVKSDARRSRDTDRLLTEEKHVDLLWPMDFSDIQPIQSRPEKEVSKLLSILDEIENESEGSK